MNRTFSPLQQFLLTWILILTTGWLTFVALDYVGELISILTAAGLIAFLLNYAVVILQRFVPRSIAAIAVYLAAAVGVTLLALILVPPVFNQGRQLVSNLPALIESARMQLSDFAVWSDRYKLPFNAEVLTTQLLERVQGAVEAIATRSVGVVLGTFTWLLDLILILVLSFYMLLDAERVWGLCTSMFSPKIRDGLSEALKRNLQRFVSGQLLLGLFMATTLSLAFWILNVRFFLLFAVFIGAMEVIPFVGATLGITTVVIIVAFIDFWLALQVLAVSFVFQQIKDNFVAPRIMGNLTGLSPVLILVSLLLGAKVGGLLGVILAIPLTGVVKSLLEIVREPTLPPQTGEFFNNPLLSSEGRDRAIEMSAESEEMES